MITIHEVTQGSDSWLELRAGLYTGSNAHKLLEHAAKTKVINGKVSSYAQGEISNFKGNFHTKRGHILEDEAIELYERITARNIDRPGFVTNTRFPGCGYSPDGIRADRTIECKAFQEDKHMKMYNGEIPITVQAQCHFGMLICGKKLCDLLIYNPDLDAKYALKIITIRWNPRIAANFRRILSPERIAT